MSAAATEHIPDRGKSLGGFMYGCLSLAPSRPRDIGSSGGPLPMLLRRRRELSSPSRRLLLSSLLFSFLARRRGRPPSSGLAGCETMSLPLGSRCRTCVRVCARARLQEAPWLWSVPRSRWLTPETPAPPGGPPSKYQRHTGRPRRTWHAHKRGPPRCALGAQTHMLFVYSCECAPIHTRKSKQRP